MKHFISIIIITACLLSCKSQREKELYGTVETLSQEDKFYYKLNLTTCIDIRQCLEKIDMLATNEEIKSLACGHASPMVKFYHVSAAIETRPWQLHRHSHTADKGLYSLSLFFYDTTKHKTFNVTFNGGKMFVERNIRKVEIKKNMKTNEVVSTDTVLLNKKDSIPLNEHDKNSILALLKGMEAQPQTPKRNGTTDDEFYCDVKYQSGRITINSNTLTSNTSIASIINLIRKMSPIKITF